MHAGRVLGLAKKKEKNIENIEKLKILQELANSTLQDCVMGQIAQHWKNIHHFLNGTVPSE